MSKMIEKPCPLCHGCGEVFIAAYDRFYECFQCDGTGYVLVEEETKEEKEEVK